MRIVDMPLYEKRLREGNRDWVKIATDQARAYVGLLQSGSLISTDRLWIAITLPKPREPRAMAAVMQNLRREGLITPTMQYQRSQQPQNHGRPVRIWEVA